MFADMYIYTFKKKTDGSLPMSIVGASFLEEFVVVKATIRIETFRYEY